MKDIVTLCRELPSSEPEIREREAEFDDTVAEMVCGYSWFTIKRMNGEFDGRVLTSPSYPFTQASSLIYFPCTPNWGMHLPIQQGCGVDYLNSITDAKSATDAIIASAPGGAWWEFWLHNTASGFHCELHYREGYSIHARVVAQASTEELARSAACVLAAEAMKGEK